MKASDLLARCLEHEGVEWVFGIPGEETLDVMDSLLSSQVKFVLTKHESSAAFMAGAVGRLTRRPGVCMATLGPGAANLVGGVADAYLSNAPMVALAGQRNASRYDPPSKQVLDLVSIFRPITKDSISLRNTDNLPVLVRKAFDIAVQERPGPVFMELPEDLMGQESSALPQPGHPPECVRPERSSFHQLAETIREAEAPLVIAGHGVVRGRASEALVRFCHAWNLPVVHTWMAAGAVPCDDSCSMGTIGARTNDRLRAMYEKADLVIIVGADLSEFPPTFWNIGRPKEAIYFGQVPLDHFENFVPEVQVIGGLRYMLEALAEIGRTRPSWHDEMCAQVLAQLAEPALDGKAGVHPKNIVLALRHALGKQDLLCSDVGAHLMWLAKFYPAYRENTLLIPYGLFPMGIGLPTAIAAKLVHPSHKVVAAVGDGGLMMTIGEMETAKRLGLGIAVVVFDDQGLGLIKDKMQKHLGRQSGMDFGPTDYVKLAEAFGAEGHEVSTLAALSSTLADVLSRDALAIIAVKVDYCHNHCVIP